MMEWSWNWKAKWQTIIHQTIQKKSHGPNGKWNTSGARRTSQMETVEPEERGEERRLVEATLVTN